MTGCTQCCVEEQKASWSDAPCWASWLCLSADHADWVWHQNEPDSEGLSDGWSLTEKERLKGKRLLKEQRPAPKKILTAVLVW